MQSLCVAETDQFGRFFLKAREGTGLVSYYQSVDAIRPLLQSRGWARAVTGFYLNIGAGNAVRLSYFTDAPTEATRVVSEFATKSGLQETAPAESPGSRVISERYGGEELRFRRFLSTYSRIGLDIMEANLLNAKCLLATFRWQVFLSGGSYRRHFEGTFVSQSAWWRTLGPADQEQFWIDLSNWPNPPQVDWAHMLVNMVLGLDWLVLFTSRGKYSPGSIEEINEILCGSNLEYRIPDGWCAP